MRFLFHWGAVTLALGAADWLLAGVRIDSLSVLAVGGVVLGLVNALVRPVMWVLTLPVTLMTLGLFYLVVNGAAFGLAAAIVGGFRVDGPGSAVLGATVVSVVSWLINLMFGDDRKRKREKKK